jgi:acylphosphatase
MTNKHELSAMIYELLTMNLTAKHITVKGNVQGVFFRKNTKEVAINLNVKGWVKNTDDGNVEILAQGNEDAIEQLILWCKHGPPKATVTDVIVKEIKPDNSLQEFLIDR